ncbi:MAG: hypothetical protein HY360_04660 [Verrucomicrobia bacterium]|nr:hypothetical protein [Verrucomicrobiota bacterium]
MKQRARFVAGGGWIRHTVVRRPITDRLMLTTTILGILSAIMVGSFVITRVMLETPTPWNDILSSPILLILMAPILLLIVAVIVRSVEKPREISIRTSNPDYHPNNLY